MFVLKFVPTIYDEPALQVLIGCHNKSANQIAHCSIIVNTRNELQNKHWNFATNILNLQTKKQTEIESKTQGVIQILRKHHVSLLSQLRGVSTKLYFNLIFTTQTYKEVIIENSFGFCILLAFQVLVLTGLW